eukprot:1059081-Rhodomonas_salina.1
MGTSLPAVLRTHPTVLRGVRTKPYAVSSTEEGHPYAVLCYAFATRCPGTEIGYVLRVCYAVSGTEIAYQAETAGGCRLGGSGLGEKKVTPVALTLLNCKVTALFFLASLGHKCLTFLKRQRDSFFCSDT